MRSAVSHSPVTCRTPGASRKHVRLRRNQCWPGGRLPPCEREKARARGKGCKRPWLQASPHRRSARLRSYPLPPGVFRVHVRVAQGGGALSVGAHTENARGRGHASSSSSSSLWNALNHMRSGTPQTTEIIMPANVKKNSPEAHRARREVSAQAQEGAAPGKEAGARGVAKRGE
jgi:hypothetical protein